MGYPRRPVKVRHDDALSRIGWMDFERLMADYYRDQGFTVEHCGTGGNSNARYDGGIDLKLRKADEFIIVQCKHKTADQVTHNAVHELLGIMVNEAATGAIVVTSGEFTDAAKKAGTKHGHVHLIDGIELRTLLGSRLDTLPPSVAQSVGTNPGLGRKAASGVWEEVEYRRRQPRSNRSRTGSNDAAVVLGAGALLLLMWLFASFGTRPAQTQIRRVSPAPPPSVGVSPEAVPSQRPPSADETAASSRAAVPAPQAPISSAEQARRDAETQRVLDNLKVPEMTHYRYSPLDQNKDPQSEEQAAGGDGL